MFHVSTNDRHHYCDGLSRRSFLKVGALSAAGLSLSDFLRVKAQATATNPNSPSSRDTAVILIWLDGGPTHMDTYDIKTQAPAEYRGPMGVTQTNVPGIQICDLMPRQAGMMDRISIVRSLRHTTGDHFAGAHWMLTGYLGSNAARREPQYPSVGAIAARLRGANQSGMPPYVSVPYASTVGLRPGYLSGAYLGTSYNPFQVNSDPNNNNFQSPALLLGLTV